MSKNKAVVNATIPPELLLWLDKMVEQRVFANRSHGVELCIIAGKDKYGR